MLSTLAALLAAALAGCSGSGDSEDTVAVNGDVAIAYAKRVNTLGMNPTDGAPFAAGGDLIIREKSSPSAPEHNVTSAYTRGVGDVSDPEVSYDGKKIVFAMNCPTGNNAAIGSAVCTGRWNVWEYTLPASGFTGGSFRRITNSTADDDVDPYYLPGGGFVFASNRQTKTKTTQAVGTQPYFALDEYERERVLNLHTMDNDGGSITQISSNQSHDRNPVVRENGNIMFSRWEHVGQRNRFAVFQVKPDGTDMFTFYGPQSPGNSFLHPREMDSRGPYAGKLVSSLMSLSGTQEGGALMLIDSANFSENNAPARPGVTGNGQRQITQQTINDGRGFSLYRPRDVAVPAVGRHQPRADVVPPVRGDSHRAGQADRGVVVREPDACRDRRAGRSGPHAWRARGGQWRAAGRQRAGVVRPVHVRPRAADVPDRRCAAVRVHVRRRHRAAGAADAAGGATDRGR